MATAFKVKPTHKAVKTYYAALATYADQSVEHEGALRSAFQNLLAETGRKVRIEGPEGDPVQADGDIVAALPVDIEIVPGALRLLMPGPATP